MYEDKTPEAIKAEILAAIRQSQGLSAMAGGFADGVAGPVAEQLSEAYRALEGVTSMLFVDESSGGYIDLVGGQYYNITRREGTRAYCDISFSGTPGLVIPKGTAFLTAGGLSYALMAAVALGPEGTGRGRLEAAEAGSVLYYPPHPNSDIAGYHVPVDRDGEELVGKTAIAIVNLPPRKMMGIASEGMLISAVHEEDGHEGLNLLMVDDRIPAGAKLY